MEIEFPIEFTVFGTPVSQRARRPASLEEWKQRIRAAAAAVLPQPHFASDRKMSVTLYYFPSEPMQGDIDNIVKPVLDALSRHVYLDDQQVERLLIQRLDPDGEFVFEAASNALREAMEGARPLLYVRISDSPYEELTG